MVNENDSLENPSEINFMSIGGEVWMRCAESYRLVNMIALQQE